MGRGCVVGEGVVFVVPPPLLFRFFPLSTSTKKLKKKMRQATRGLELTRLKSLLDDGGDHHSFFRLAYHDLQGVYRTAVLQHVAAEGDALLAAWSSAHPGGPPGVTLKVVSDIDDTLVCSAGHYPAGVDRRLPKGCPYPGACALLNELDAGHALRVSEAVAARLAELDKSTAAANAAAAKGDTYDDDDDDEGSSKKNERDGSWTPRGGSPPPSPRLCAIFPPLETSQFSFNSTSSSSSAAAAAAAAAAAGANGQHQPPLTSTSTTTTDETALIRRVARGAAARTRGALLAPWSSEFEQAAWHRITQAAQAPAPSSTSRGPSAFSQQQQQQHQNGTSSSGKQPPSPQQQHQHQSFASAPLPPPPPPGGRLHQRGGHLAFLSARPETYKGLTEATSYRHIFAPLIDGRHLHQAPLLLLGSMRAGPRALWRYLLRDDIPRAGAKGGGGAGRTAAEEAAAAVAAAAAAAAATSSSSTVSSSSSSAAAPAVAAAVPPATKSPPPADGLSSQLYFSIFRRKLEQFEKYAALHREAAFVFIGDNGQGDVLLAEELHRRSRARTSGRSSQSGGGGASSYSSSSPFNLVAAFILRVTPVTATLSSLRCSKANKAAWLASWRSEGIYFHKTFVGVAARAATLGLIDAGGLQRVALEAHWGLRAARAAHAFSHVDWSRVARQLNKDVRAANGWLPGSMRLAPLRVGGDDGSAAFDAARGGGGGDRSDRGGGERSDREQLQRRRSSLPRTTREEEGGSPPPRSPSPDAGGAEGGGTAAKAQQQQPLLAAGAGAPLPLRSVSTPPVMLRQLHWTAAAPPAVASASASASIPAPIGSPSSSSRRQSRGGSPSPGGSSPLFGTSPVSAWPPSWSAGLGASAVAAAAAASAAASRRPGSSRGSSPPPRTVVATAAAVAPAVDAAAPAVAAAAPAVAAAPAAPAPPAEPTLADKTDNAGNESAATANDDDDEGDASGGGTPPPSRPPRTLAM